MWLYDIKLWGYASDIKTIRMFDLHRDLGIATVKQEIKSFAGIMKPGDTYILSRTSSTAV